MNQPQSNVATLEAPRKSVLITMATNYNMEPAAFEQTLRATVFPKDGSKEQFAAFLVVANAYGLNPLTKEIYAFPAKGGGVQPIVPIDGWTNIINSNPNFDGVEFDDLFDEKGALSAITCRIWRKDRSHPIVVTEYLVECKRATDTWKQYPHRMLRHKALIQCARYAFGFAGIVDPDEAERIIGAEAMRDVTPKPPAPTPPKPSLAAPQAVQESAPQNPAKIMEAIDARLAEVTDAARLQTVWNEELEHLTEGMFPPDQEQALEIYRKHEQRITPL